MFASFLVPLLALSGRASCLNLRQNDDTCICTGADYLDHETYLIDGTKIGNFSFASTFEGNVETRPFEIIVSLPLTTTAIVRSTSALSRATTITTTLTTTSFSQTTTRTTIPNQSVEVVTVVCNTALTLTTTTQMPPSTITEWRTIIRVSASDRVTSSTFATSTLTPVCRFPSSTTAVRVTTAVATLTRLPTTTSTANPLTGAFTFTTTGSICVGNSPWGPGSGGSGGGWGPGRGGGWGPGSGGNWGGPGGGGGWGGGNDLPPWVTCRPTGIAFTTSGRWGGGWGRRQVPGTRTERVTVTRVMVDTVTQTITPPARTVCVWQRDVTQTATVPGPVLTVVRPVTSVTRVAETVFVTQTILSISTNSASATACSRAGGVYEAGQG
ncbi:hypothetical protein QBC36DRAFT_354605 [Triangularia setosa]|uniref:Uncharacterized protein n=1 Tax=Triangularia setosa TaxID=2587417 RepID=A0AAN6W8I0_9PEZI|nr:hypothetical protein QBC36DRAFT_354605 [Podospora setosa]